MPLLRHPEAGLYNGGGLVLGALSLPLGPLILREASGQVLKTGSPVQRDLQGVLEAAPSPAEP